MSGELRGERPTRGSQCETDGSAEDQDFVSSVSTLLTVRQGTGHLRRRIGELDGQMGDVGRALGEKVRYHSALARDTVLMSSLRNVRYWSRKR